MKTPLLLSNLSSLVGKTISWEAEAYKGNATYKGIEKIIEIDLTCRRPIVCSQSIDSKSDCICFAFLDDHSLTAIPEGYKIETATGENNCLSYSDSYREVFYEIVEVSVSTENPIVKKDLSEIVYNGYFQSLEGKNFYNLYASYDAKLDIKTGECYKISHSNYNQINLPQINDLLKDGILVDYNYGKRNEN